MTKSAWLNFTLATLGPVIGWFAQDFYQPDKFAALGMAVFISWSGFWTLRGLSQVDWALIK